MDNLPQSFDELHSQLDNAATLSSADVTLGLTVSGDSSHNLHQLRFAAGNAVSNGLNYETAIAAISSNIATAFSLTSKGTIEPGKDADLILWTGDPLEFSSTPANVWIGGVEQSIETRQDKLRDRYLSDSDLPRAYIQ
jgi:imidazolonepropionase-like amidohydrolase